MPKDYQEIYKNRIRLSKSKNKYFFSGKIIEWIVLPPDGRAIKTYPAPHTISFVDHWDWSMFSTCKYDKEKEKRIMHVQYNIIDYILLDFNSFDWKKYKDYGRGGNRNIS